MLSTTHIKIQIDQHYPIIHFCSGGSIVTKHKWPSSCLMSMIIISAICQGFLKHLIWTQHKAGMDSSPTHCLPLTNHLYWYSLYSLFAPLSFAVCPFFNHLHLGYSFNPPSPTPSSLFPPNPHPYPVRLIMSCQSLGKCHYGNRGRGSGGLSMGERGKQMKRVKKTQKRLVLRNPRVVIWCKSYPTKEM